MGDMTNETIAIPNEIYDRWQDIVDLIAKIVCVPAGLIMRVHQKEIEVFVTSKSKGNPYKKGELANLNTGLYCETVMAQRGLLIVPDARKDLQWDNNPDLELEMVSYMGLPLVWPDRKIFGTICVLDKKENTYSKLYQQLLHEFSEMINGDLALIASNFEREKFLHELTNT